MIRYLAAAAALAALTGCAGMQPAGRNAAERAPPPPSPAAVAALPSAAPAPQVQPAPVQAATSAQPEQATPATGDEQVIVPGQREQQVRPPNGDPRSVAQRREDVRNWDSCVLEAQADRENDPTRPDLTSPEDYCSRSLGMADRSAVPQWRLEGRRRP